RRHTRSKRDWSSDVCSSDLEEVGGLALPLVTPLGSDDHDGGHGDSWGRDSTRDWWPRGGHGAAGIVPSTPGRTLRAPALGRSAQELSPGASDPPRGGSR